MQKSAQAQSPGHITGFFVIYPNGSTGAGVNIGDGMKTSVQGSSKDSFSMNGKKAHLPVSQMALKLFRQKTKSKGKVKISHHTKFPIGYGLGISGAGALSLCFALNKLFAANLSKKEITEIAKRSEIKCGTGLGDVIAENFSGLMVGKKPYPSKSAQELAFEEKYVVLGFIAPITTKKIIRSPKWKRKINKIGSYCMREFLKEKSMAKFIKFSRVFTRFTGIGTARVKKILEKTPTASMAMLGETIFSPTNNPGQVERELKKLCKRTREQ